HTSMPLLYRDENLRLESRRPFIHYVESAFQRDAHASNRSFVEQAAYQGYAVGHAAWRRELGQRMCRVRRPIAARLRNLHEAGAQREAGMAGKVRDGQDLVAQ